MINEVQVDDLHLRIDVVEQTWQFAIREFRIYMQTEAGAALARVETDLGDLHPVVTGPNSRAWLDRRCRIANKPLGRLYGILFDGEPKPGHGLAASEVDSTIASFWSDMPSHLRGAPAKARHRALYAVGGSAI